MMYLGDFPASATVYCKFSTNAAAGSRVDFSNALEAADIRVYKNGSATKRSSTAGFTVTSGFDSMVGVHHVTLDLSDNTDAGFYAAGADYQIVLYPDETVDGLSVAAVVGCFSIENRAGLRPTTAGRTLDVAANGALDADSTTAISAAIWTDVRSGYKGTGTAAGGGANSIILASGAGAALDVKAGDFIMVLIDSVPDGNVVQSISTDTATMEGNWGGGISPDADDPYYVYAGGSGVTTAVLSALVATELVDALTVDTRAELAAVPAANAPITDKLNFIFMMLRNKITQTSTTQVLKADDTTTTVGTRTVSDDGTTFTQGEIA